MRKRALMLRALGALALGAWFAQPMLAAGFGLFEQGAKAQGMAGAFTAQADDPSLLFHNAGGLGFVNRFSWSASLTYFKGTTATFRGLAPFPGPTARAEQKLIDQPTPQVYVVAPINATWKWGIGLETPFGLTTEWKNPTSFAGRFLSTKASLEALDLNPTIGWQATPTLGIGIGAIARFSDLELKRNQAAINPFTLRVADVAAVDLKTGFKTGYGFNVGLLEKFSARFSLGLSYRSKVKVDYTGDARLTQILTGFPQFDAAVAAQTPFGRNLPVKTSIDFPDMASLGLAFGLTPNLLLETDANWTGWSSFDVVDIDFTNGALPSSSVPEHWKNAWNYRAGLRWNSSPSSQWRIGYVYDQTPQPEEAISPLLPDADRNGYAIGYGWTGVHKFDVALSYIDFKSRSRQKSFTGDGDFFGTYKTRALILGAMFTW
jgi:long-chain fatty acid transport protein